MLATLHVFIVNKDASPLITTLLPAVVGAVLGVGGSLLLRRGEHDWQERRETETQRWQERRSSPIQSSRSTHAARMFSRAAWCRVICSPTQADERIQLL